ncbi:MAG: PIN domain-containing protein [Akkermansiaceae bacterium]|jgi:predicted nucleic acid-binding protein|nr:PIN domain-containing protein [Akkermansiaceae bacterium]
MKPESVLVDSNVFMDYMKRGRDPVRELLSCYDSTDLVTCGVVKAEVLRGIKSLKARAQLESFFDLMRFAPTRVMTWDQTWKRAWQLDRKGRVLPLTDLAIATCAIAEEAWILTSDHHFDHIDEVNILRPDF